MLHVADGSRTNQVSSVIPRTAIGIDDDSSLPWEVLHQAGTDRLEIWTNSDARLSPTALAADAMGNLYLAGDNLQWRDGQGLLSVIAPAGTTVGQVSSPTGLAVDSAGTLYVADSGNDRVQKYTPGP